MRSKKPTIHIRLRKDRLDVLKLMVEELNERNVPQGGKKISFNAFIEEIVERFFISDYGHTLCGLVDERRKRESADWKAKEKEKAAVLDEKHY